MPQGEPLPIENVQDYPRPPVLEAVPQRLTVLLNGTIIVDSSNARRVLETHHAPTYYIPPIDVTGQLIPVAGSSNCEWKGVARYFDVAENGFGAVALLLGQFIPLAELHHVPSPFRSARRGPAHRMARCYGG